MVFNPPSVPLVRVQSDGPDATLFEIVLEASSVIQDTAKGDNGPLYVPTSMVTAVLEALESAGVNVMPLGQGVGATLRTRRPTGAVPNENHHRHRLHTR